MIKRTLQVMLAIPYLFIFLLLLILSPLTYILTNSFGKWMHYYADICEKYLNY